MTFASSLVIVSKTRRHQKLDWSTVDKFLRRTRTKKQERRTKATTEKRRLWMMMLMMLMIMMTMRRRMPRSKRASKETAPTSADRKYPLKRGHVKCVI